MQVLERTGEDRDKRAACHADSGAQACSSQSPVLDSGSIALSAQDEEELAIQASQLTAAAVAAAAVTAAVVTAADTPAERLDAQPASPSAAAPSRPPRGLQGAQAASIQSQPSLRGAWKVSLLTLGIIALALWLGQQWPQRALKPWTPTLPGLGQAEPAPGASASAPAQALEPHAPVAVEQAPGPDAIALLQQESEEKARLLAHRRTLVEARQHREDAALALREQRRRQAEQQLAEARARAERAQAGAVAAPELAAAPPVPSLADQVAQCRTLSLFSRESCLWKLCGGNWGKNGCPSYERNNEGA